MFIVGIVIYTVICVGFIKYYYPKEGILSTALLFVAGATIYYIAIPIELYISRTGILLGLDDSDLALVIFLSAAAVVSFCGGYFLSGFRLKQSLVFVHEDHSSGNNHSLFLVSINSLLLLSMVFLLVFFAKDLQTSIQSYEANYTITYNASTFNYLKTIFITTSSIAGCWYICIRKKIRIGMFLVVIVIAFGILTSDKNPILIGMLPLTVWICGHMENAKHGVVSSVLLLCIILLTILLIPIFSLYRGGVDIFNIATLKDNYYFSFTKIDPAGPFVSLAEIIRVPPELLLGKSYFNNFLILIPKTIFADRPLDLAEQFAREHIRDWEPGRGLGYSLMAEASINFGYFGMFLHYFLIGLLWGMCWRFIGKLMRDNREINVVYRTFGFYLLILMHRGPSIGIMKTLIQFLIPLLIIMIIVYIVRSSIRYRTRGLRSESIVDT